MVGTLAALQLKLFGRGIRNNAARVLSLILGVLFLGFLLLQALIGTFVLRGHSVPLVGSVTTVAYALVLLMWPMITLMVVGSDPTLDPGRFALFPVTARQLLPGLLVASVMSLGGIFTTLLTLGLVVAWSDRPVAAALAVVATPLGVLTCILVSRVLAAYFASAMASRRYRDVAGVIFAVLMMSIGLIIQTLSGYASRRSAELPGMASRWGSIAAWTPVGWAYSLPWAAAEGRWPVVVVRLVLAAGLVALLVWLWRRRLDEALCSPLETFGHGAKVKADSIVDRMVPQSPAGAIAARSLRYWRRDPRRAITGVSIVILPFLMFVPLVINPPTDEGGGQASVIGDWVLMYPVFGVLLLAGITVASEISYDGSAIGTQIVTGVSGRDDRWGRIIALSWILVPLVLLQDVIFLAITRVWHLVPALLGASFGALAAGMAVGTLVSSRWQYSTVPPGGNPFGSGSSGGSVGFLSSMLNMIGSFVVALPFTVPALLAGVQASWWGWVSLALAIALGPLMVRWACKVGGRELDKTWPEVLKAVTYTKK